MRLLLSFLCLSQLTSSDVSPLTFNDELRDRLQKFQPTLGTKALVNQRSLISMLARYARIHKHFVKFPHGVSLSFGALCSDESGWEARSQIQTASTNRYRLPDPAPDFDDAVAIACSNGTEADDIATNCLEYMTLKILPKTNWANRSIDLLDTKLFEQITDSAFAEVLTFVEIMCWATRNQLSFMEDIPCADKFYTKIPNEAGGFHWDGILNTHSLNTLGGPLHSITTFHENPFHCSELSFCPAPCSLVKRKGCTFERHLNIDLQGMIDNKWNLTFPCGNNQIYRPDLDICVHKDDCMCKDCPANSVCEEGLPTSRCICSLGFAPDTNRKCVAIDLSAVHIPWRSPYADGSAGLRWTLGIALVIILR